MEGREQPVKPTSELLAFAPLGIGVVPYEFPSSVKLADATLKQIKKYDVVLWEKHGTVAVGTDVFGLPK